MMIPDDDPYQQDPYDRREVPMIEPENPTGFNQWLMAVTLTLIIVVAIAIGYTVHEQRAAQRLVSANGRLAADLSQAQGQMAALTAKVNALSAPKPVEPAPPGDETWNGKAVRPAPTAEAHVHRTRTRPAPSAWQRKMQSQLTAQQKQLTDAEQALAKTQADLSAQSASTQSGLTGLGGSIAKDHAELVALEKLGQRDYFEFNLSKSKKFAREGPISLDLRHTSAKHQNYDLDLLVDDYKLSKKNVNLYEPVVLQTAENPQPLELVVNRIGKNEIHGYISAPKTYEQRASASSAMGASSSTQPVSSTAATPSAQTATPVADTTAPQAIAAASHQ
ncbi:MAG TPA: hypothetical protein VGY31_03900 [Terriglobia bacterium]|nr:hypothetical protein [Terriglobia bacterium]